nr:MAG TPA: hypothetical protein [Caudoviricetes sp.]
MAVGRRGEGLRGGRQVQAVQGHERRRVPPGEARPRGAEARDCRD